MSITTDYLQFVAENHAQGSGTAQSYVTAINKLEKALHEANLLASTQSLWKIRDIDYLAKLYNLVKAEQKKEDGGIFHNETAKSYWQKGFCSAALKQWSQFISLSSREDIMLKKIAVATDASQLGRDLVHTPIANNPLLIDDELDIASVEGRTALRKVEVRLNQIVFRKMILTHYNRCCCLTGLPVPEILRASHISGWAMDIENRMNPANGLCLSATYDAAFDRHLISFDDDYRMILAPSLHEYCTNNAFQEQFKRFEGSKITMPIRFPPSKSLLAKHRETMR